MADQSPEGRDSVPSNRNQKSDQVEKNQVIEYSGRGDAKSGKPGFLSIYKPGQGYWTRMGTAAASLLILILLCQLLFTALDARDILPRRWIWAIVAGVFAAVSLFLWRYMNKPNVVDFMVATESEMKKVNWTSRKELIGSTKVVIVFMFLIAACLFLFDIFFGYVFYFIDVLQFPPIWG